MEKLGTQEGRKFSSAEEELNYLREQVREKEQRIEEAGVSPEKFNVVEERVSQYKNLRANEVLHDNYRLSNEEVEGVVLNLSPEKHDDKMAELVNLMREKGIKNTLAVLERMKDPHLTDDFHRYLVQYVKHGFEAKGVTKGGMLEKTLRMTLYEVVLPEAHDENGGPRPLREIVSSMEQFYAGMMSVSTKDKRARDNYIVLEIANPLGLNETSFYVAVPDSKCELFEKQLLAIFGNARIEVVSDDYNVFSDGGVSLGSIAKMSKSPILPIKTYDEFDYDPLNAVLNSFSKIERENEGAAIQLVFKPSGDLYTKKYRSVLREVEKGEDFKNASNISDGFLSEVTSLSKDVVKDIFSSKSQNEEEKIKEVDHFAVDAIKTKLDSPVALTNIRIVASAPTRTEAENILSDLESGFNQFERSNANRFEFERPKKGALAGLFRNFSYRRFNSSNKIPLNLKELASVYHLQTDMVRAASQLKRSTFSTAEAPSTLPQNGTVLGLNSHRGTDTIARIDAEDRLRHFYTIGQTGTGKTALMKNMIIQDIEAGDGCCMIDPHGVDVQDVLANIPPERYEDVIYFDPGNSARPMGLNMLEYDINNPEQKTFVVNELFSIFQRLYSSVPESMGPMFEQYFRNATMLVIEDPDSGNTLLDVSRVLSNKDYRDLKLSRCRNPIVVQFWEEVASQAGGESSLQNIVPYITSKFDVFLANDVMRPIIAQEHSAFNFRDIMDGRKILLVNLAKGRLGDINSNLLGLILVGKILMAALSRVDVSEAERPPFYLYIDEFQNITTDSISVILSEARKYKLSLNIAHQFIAQLDEGIKNSVFGNVGSMAAFRVGAEDAEYLSQQFAPTFEASDLMNVDNYNAYIKMLINGRPAKPFNVQTYPPPMGDTSIVDDLKELSLAKYGRDREEVENEVMAKYRKL